MGVGHPVDAGVGAEDFDEDVEGLTCLSAGALRPLGEYGYAGDIVFGKRGEQRGCGSVGVGWGDSLFKLRGGGTDIFGLERIEGGGDGIFERLEGAVDCGGRYLLRSM